MYKPTDLLDQLSQAAREQAREENDRLDPRWDRLAAGQLSAEENDELLGLADASGEAHQACQAFKPLGPAFEKRVAAAIFARQQVEAEERLAEAAAEAPAVTAWPSSPEPPPAPAKRWGWVLGSFGSAAGLVAGLGAFFLFIHVAPMSNFEATQPPGISEDRGEPTQPSGLSENRGESTQPPGISEVRGVPTQPPGLSGDRGGIAAEQNIDIPVYSSGDEIPLLAKASINPGDDLEARLFYVGDDRRLERSSLEPKIEQDGGKVSFQPIVGKDLNLSPGNWRLVMVIARPSEFPGPATILGAVSSDGRADEYWQVLVYPIKIEEPETEQLEPGHSGAP